MLSQPMNPLIEVKDLVKDYGAFRAVDHADFEVFPGDVFGFLGPNGAGKSTTLRMMLTLIRPTEGRIQIFGKDLQQHRTEILSRIGCIIEKPDFYKYLSARKNLQIFARWSGTDIPKTRVDELLEFVGLGDRGKDKVAGFSHGMRQRLGLAQALLNNPDLVILDEPTTGLDPQGIIEVRELILRLRNEQKKTVVLSSHLLSEIELIANRMVILNKGKTLVQGEVATLLNAQDLIVLIQISQPALAWKCLTESGFAANMLKCKEDGLQLNIQKSQVPEITRFLVNQGFEIFSIESRRKLEDYFLQLTGR